MTVESYQIVKECGFFTHSFRKMAHQYSTSLTSKPVGISRNLLPVVSCRVFVRDAVTSSQIAVYTPNPDCPRAKHQLTHS